ncbi:MAG TPA: tetratricopeptide repeat protein, partial [Gammaproteobacteria bacterium]|nr:tetratricopeptide repeat protein [Gammaproteobacteria bacterium]
AYSAGEYDRAAVLAEQTLKLANKTFGRKHPNTLISMNNLAALNDDLGRYEQAEPLFIETLALSKEILGLKHPNTLTSMSNLAELYRVQGRYEQAEPLFTETLALSKEILGLKHPDTLIDMDNLASLYKAQGRYEQAEPLFTETLALSKEILGLKHPDTLLSMDNLASLYKAQGRYEQAEPLYIETLALSKEILGLKHPDTLLSMSNLALLYKAQGRYEQAFKWYKLAADQGLATAQFNLAVMFEYGQGINIDYKKALEWYTQAANNNYKRAAFRLGETYQLGTPLVSGGFIEDNKNAIYWFKKAKSLGSIKAIVRLGAIYSSKETSLKQENFAYDPIKALKYLEIGMSDKNLYAYRLVAYGYRYGTFVKKNTVMAVELLLESSQIENISISDRQDLIVTAFEYALTDELIKLAPQQLATNILITRAEGGDYKSQNLLAKAYRNPAYIYMDSEQAKYWSEIAAKSSIQANIDLAYLEQSHVGNESLNPVQYLEKAILLYEQKKAKDYTDIKKFNPNLIIGAYHWLAEKYLMTAKIMQVEGLLRKAEGIYLQSGSKYHESHKLVILANLAALQGDIEESDRMLGEVIEQYMKGNALNHSSFMQAVSSNFGLFYKNKEYEKAIAYIEKYLAYISKLSLGITLFGDQDLQNSLQSYKAIWSIEVAYLYAITENTVMAKKYLDQYLELEQERTLTVAGVNAAFSVLDGDISIADDELIFAKKMIQTENMVAGIRTLSYLSEIGRLGAKQGYYKFAAKWLGEGLSLYIDSVLDRIANGIEILAYEKTAIRNAISDYIYFSKKSGYQVDGLTPFRVMQLTAGLSVSKSIERMLGVNNESPDIQKLQKQIDLLNVEKNKLLRKKYKIPLGGTERTLAVNELLSNVDTQVSYLRDELKLFRESVTYEKDYLQSVEKVRESLDKGDAFLTLLVSDVRTHVWLITQEGVFQHDSELGLKQINSHVDQLKEALSPNQGLRSDFSFKSSKALYELIVNPFTDQLKGIDRLIIAPDPVLSGIPFSILASVDDKSIAEGKELIDMTSPLRGVVEVNPSSDSKTNTKYFKQVNWLIEQFSIAVVPSVYSYIKFDYFKKTRDAAEFSFIGIGNPKFDGGKDKKVFSKEEMISSVIQRGFSVGALSSLAPLPETAVELAFIARHFSDSLIVTGLDATEEKIREMDLRQYNVISFATHALVSNELTGLVEPSLVLTPIDAENPANDGLLTASEIMKLDLDADMVLLSACNTASSSGVSNSEGLSGLANSFFQAGAKSLLVSYWSVISESAVDITTRMFSPTNTGRSYAHRHRNSVLELLKESEGTIKSHPSYWAPFSVIGVN